MTSAIGSAQARPVSLLDCDDRFAECKEDCAIKWGGTTNYKSQAQLYPCLRTCETVETDCREISSEADRKGSDTAGKPNEKKQIKPSDDPEPAPLVKNTNTSKEDEEQVPKSSRSTLPKGDGKADKPKAGKPEEVKSTAKLEEAKPAARPEEAKPSGKSVEAKKTGKPEEPKQSDKAQEPKKKDARKRTVDEWDPDAL